MGPRPTHLRLTSNEREQPPQPPKMPFSNTDLPSPRTGEVPPALSPLDAFAMHSRILAKRFEEPNEEGRRISRLPYNDVAKELANRPGYFRATSHGSEMSDVPEESSPLAPGTSQTVVPAEDEKSRPKSQYPFFGMASNRNSAMSGVSGGAPFYDAQEQLSKPGGQDYFGVNVPRATSPEPVDLRMVNIQAASPLNIPSLTNSVDSVQSTTQPRTLTNGSTRSNRSLAPPKSPAYPKSPRSMQSIRSVPPDSGDEEVSTSGSHAVSSSRKFSGSSGMSRPQSPFSPWMPPMYRSPSMTSEFSMNGSQRRTNFSRPLSSGSSRPQPDARPSFESRSSFETRPSEDMPHRNPSAASGSTHPSSGMPSRQASQDEATPFGPPLPMGDANEDEFDDRPTTSYTYRTYELPRGRFVERDSRGTRESWIRKQFTWDEATPAEPQKSVRQERRLSDPPPVEPPAQRTVSPAHSERVPQERQERVGRDRAMSNTNRSRSAEPRAVQPTVQKAAAIHKSTPSVRTHNTDSTDRTVKPAVPLHERSPSAELTAEEHLEIGIQSHSNGELSKSTYHLRIAAREGSPTGMLLYALACRHGWGMRPNQEEGVRWLKHAIDSAGLEVADVEQTLSAATKSQGDPATDVLERKKRKAQFALAIYELGISYMNGWGCPKDKPLAVRCFEVAGSWGDCDALAEAGYCYTQGVGCKKDLKKAASLYRQAADGGMSMAGNSW